MEKFRNKFNTRISNKIINFYLKSFIILFVLIFFGFIYGTFSFKVANIETGNDKIFGKYLFYNQDYYFLDICGKQIIIPSNEVKSIEIRMSKLDLTNIENKNKVVTLNDEYINFCEEYLKKN